MFLGDVAVGATPKFTSLVELVQHYRSNIVAAEVRTTLMYPAREIERLSPRKLSVANSRSLTLSQGRGGTRRFEADEGSTL